MRLRLLCVLGLSPLAAVPAAAQAPLPEAAVAVPGLVPAGPQAPPGETDVAPASLVLRAAAPAPVRLLAADTPVVAVSYSDAYYTRLAIHRIGSYVILPLFGAQYLLGRSLLEDDVPADWVKPAHVVAASGVGALFAVNTVTGALNLWESRRVPEGRARRFLHAGLMLAAEAGFVYTATLAGDARLSDANAREHRNAALASMGASAASTLLMWIWN